MLRYYKYHLPFKEAFVISGKKYLNREGIILTYQTENFTAYGEVAPLPGFSVESLDQVEEVLTFNRNILQQSLADGTTDELIEVFDQIHNFPSLSFGLDTLLHDVAAKKKGVNLPRHLLKKKPAAIQVNATLPIKEFKETLKDAEFLVEEGYQTLKIKVGVNFDKEAELLKLLREKYPHIKLRIDANQAWTVNEAINNLKSLKNLQIEYCEQPVDKDDIEGLKAVKNSSNILIAADESVRNKNDINELLETEAVDLLILKPTLLGSFKNIFVTKRMADSHNIKAIVTTCLESAIGRAATAVISLTQGAHIFDQGLGTGKLFKKDVGHNSWLNKNIIHWPEKSGLGVSVELDSLEEI